MEKGRDLGFCNVWGHPLEFPTLAAGIIALRFFEQSVFPAIP